MTKINIEISPTENFCCVQKIYTFSLLLMILTFPEIEGFYFD